MQVFYYDQTNPYIKFYFNFNKMQRISMNLAKALV